MCASCGCENPSLVAVEVGERVLAANDRAAAHNRRHFAERGVLAVNLMGSPGSGKTALLEAVARAMGKARHLAAITGDLETDRDAQRLRAAGIPCVPVTTGSACHLDAEMVHRAFHLLADQALDCLFVENVGNLVCPALFDLGQAVNVVALSVTEGEDKPLKYPAMFRGADLVVLTKVDLLPHLDFDLPFLETAIARVMPRNSLVPFSARTGAGVDALCEWLEARRLAQAGRERPEGIKAALTP